MSTPQPLGAVIAAWDAARVAEQQAFDEEQIPAHVRERGTVLLAPASEDEVQAAEARLGTRLPPSYRQFLLTSNGAHADAIGIGLRNTNDVLPDPPPVMWPAAQIAWARDVVPGSVLPWALGAVGDIDDVATHPAYDTRLPEDEYLDHPAEQDPVDAKTGHPRHSLCISVGNDGYLLLLNPLVQDAQGEWEVLDFGPKNPGSFRYGSFAHFLRANASDSRTRAESGAEDEDDFDTSEASIQAALAAAADTTLSPDQRVESIVALSMANHSSAEFDAVLVAFAADTTVPPYHRTVASQMLRGKTTPQVVALVSGLAEEAGPFPLRSLIELATSLDDDVAGDVARRLLRDPSSRGAISFVYSDPTGAFVSAFRETGRFDLLKQGVRVRRSELVEPALDALEDESIPAGERRLLVYDLRHNSLAPWVERLAEIGTRPCSFAEDVALAIVDTGHGELALPVFRQALERERPSSWIPGHLADIGSADAIELIGVAARHQNPELRSAALTALARVESPELVELVEQAAVSEETRLQGIDALELAGSTEARDALERIAAGGITPAMRALARLGDDRVLPQCFALLGGDDPARRREAAEALRDLRHPDSSEPLMEAALAEGGDVATIAAHAIAMIGGPGAVAALRAIESVSQRDQTCSLIARWTSQLEAS